MKKMRLTLAKSAFALCLGATWGATVLVAEDDLVSPDFTSPMVGFFEAGVICAQPSDGARDAPDTIAGSTHVIEDAPPFVSKGRAVPAVLGIGFGVRSGLVSEFGQDGVLMTITHPPLDGSGVTEQSFTTNIGSNVDPSVTFYQFDFGYELALGEWVMTASLNGYPIYETTFTVVSPSALPELAGVCGYLDLLS
ncbi:hypothetical protein OAN307_c03100 [Octadecabacter antarcticus 307]|uniref:DUF3859 domain-containing protein n=1 Tax=Octadecabacter antarcticus 307 TaxID=391626 RepID=M9R0C9_9RHOB|nr:DUF3859 domain-containing protein [Octadecabacter antarcticus]AGI66069.1 hypothetical protein OAN307_c03100 [Octadecabacter antarcticus 307]